MMPSSHVYMYVHVATDSLTMKVLLSLRDRQHAQVQHLRQGLQDADIIDASCPQPFGEEQQPHACLR